MANVALRVDSTALKRPHLWLRVAQVIFGIIAFAPIAEGAGYSRYDYAIFCGVTTMLFSLFLAGCHLLGHSKAVQGVPSLAYDGLYFVFWLGCAASLSDMLRWFWGGADISRLQCVAAFSWLTWFLFIASVVLDVMHLRAGGASATVSDATPAESKPAESKPAECKPADSKPDESKPVEAGMDAALPVVATV